MKVLFTASQRGKKIYGKFYDVIYDEIEKLGYTLIRDDVSFTTPDSFYKELEGDHKKNVELYKRKIQSIQKADICIYESSFHSLSIGYVIQKSLEFNKPTLVLYYKDQTPYFLTGVENEKLILHSFDEKSLRLVVKQILEEATDLREKRFNFFISPSLLTYLEKASKKSGITKSTFIRNLILQHQKKNRD